MVTQATTPDFRHIDKMMMPVKRERPSTANTMLLVLKPPREDYKQLAEISGSENEKEAYRKNRVIQMKLGAYLAEVCLQQRSSERLLKTEEYRFMQEVNRRSNVPRSVSMLQQLQQYTNKTFPNASYSYYEPSPTPGQSHPHKHPPLSARSLPRGYRHQGLLDRPKTSASTFRQSLREGIMENLYKAVNNQEHFHSSGKDERREVNHEEVIFDLKEGENTSQRLPTRQSTDLPSLWGRNVDINQSNEIEPRQISTVPEVAHKYIMPATRSKSQIHLGPRHNSLTVNASLKRMNTVSRFNASDLPIGEREPKAEDAASVDSFESDRKMATLLKEELEAFDREEGITQSENLRTDNQQIGGDKTGADVAEKSEDQELGIIDLDLAEEISRRQEDMAEKAGKRNAKPMGKKTNFNRIKAAPVVPLRHNITSVLRQERAKYEASQVKVKNYLHKMKSRDYLARGLTGADITSATSRRSSAARK